MHSQCYCNSFRNSFEVKMFCTIEQKWFEIFFWFLWVLSSGLYLLCIFTNDPQNSRNKKKVSNYFCLIVAIKVMTLSVVQNIHEASRKVWTTEIRIKKETSLVNNEQNTMKPLEMWNIIQQTMHWYASNMEHTFKHFLYAS